MSSARAIPVLGFGVLLACGCLSHSPTPPPRPSAPTPGNVLLPVQPERYPWGRCGQSAVVQVLHYRLRDGADTAARAERLRALTAGLFTDTGVLVRALRSCGVACVLACSSVDDVVAEVRAGRPVIVLVPGLDRYAPAAWQGRFPSHCWVVRGADAQGETLYVNSPGRGPRRVSRATLEKCLARQAHVSIRCLEPAQAVPPATAP